MKSPQVDNDRRTVVMQRMDEADATQVRLALKACDLIDRARALGITPEMWLHYPAKPPAGVFEITFMPGVKIPCRLGRTTDAGCLVVINPEDLVSAMVDDWPGDGEDV